jgi:DUF1680 family protein
VLLLLQHDEVDSAFVRLDGRSRFIDYYERNLLNHRLGAIQPETGLTTYFLSMSSGAWKTISTEDQTFWCCGGTALEDYAELNARRLRARAGPS